MASVVVQWPPTHVMMAMSWWERRREFACWMEHGLELSHIVQVGIILKRKALAIYPPLNSTLLAIVSVSYTVNYVPFSITDCPLHPWTQLLQYLLLPLLLPLACLAGPLPSSSSSSSSFWWWLWWLWQWWLSCFGDEVGFQWLHMIGFLVCFLRYCMLHV